MNPEKLTKVRIEVTEGLIKKGEPCDSATCPVALALRKVVAKNVTIDVLSDEIAIYLPYTEDTEFDDIYQSFDQPVKVSKFIQAFDARDLDFLAEGQPLPPLPKPFAFNLKIKNKFLRPSLRA